MRGNNRCLPALRLPYFYCGVSRRCSVTVFIWHLGSASRVDRKNSMSLNGVFEQPGHDIPTIGIGTRVSTSKI